MFFRVRRHVGRKRRPCTVPRCQTRAEPEARQWMFLLARKRPPKYKCAVSPAVALYAQRGHTFCSSRRSLRTGMFGLVWIGLLTADVYSNIGENAVASIRNKLHAIKEKSQWTFFSRRGADDRCGACTARVTCVTADARRNTVVRHLHVMPSALPPTPIPPFT